MVVPPRQPSVLLDRKRTSRRTNLGCACIVSLLLLIVLISSPSADAHEATKQECSAELGDDNKACQAEPQAQQQQEEKPKEKLHLAGFLPDGYFERARGRLVEPIVNALFDFELRQFRSRKEYQEFLPIHFPHENISTSTVVWVEDPLQVLGDSDALEKFYTTCLVGEGRASNPSCASVRNFFPAAQQKDAAKRARAASGDTGDWEHEANQGVRCRSRFGVSDSAGASFAGSLSSFHIILNRDWNPTTFESISDALRSGKMPEVRVQRPLQNDADALVFDWKGLKAPKLSELPIQHQRKAFERGTLSTDGQQVRLQLQNSGGGADTTFAPFGFIPEGDLRRTVEGWLETLRQNGDVTVRGCEFLFGGLRRVQSILAMDRVERPEEGEKQPTL